jgi:hypothetical protein
MQQSGYTLSDYEKMPMSPPLEVHWTVTEPSIQFVAVVPTSAPPEVFS